jgi:predicted NUDIX family NTP pyrophosphohydrolase
MPTRSPRGARSAGLLLHRDSRGTREVMLVHMGGPFFSRRDAGAWSIPKGEYEPGEDPLDAARREFAEETGLEPPPGPLVALGAVRQAGGKLVEAWALEGDLDVSEIHSNLFALEWPRGSGLTREFPEVDRAGWFDLAVAAQKLVKAQAEFLERLAQVLASGSVER